MKEQKFARNADPMKKILNIFDSKRNILAIGLLGGLVFNTLRIQENSNYIKKMNTVENGIQTCFTRVNQTFTANLLKQTSSAYLSQGFQTLTEECFAEAVSAVEELGYLQASDVQKKLSGLSSNVHWFHEDLLAGTSAGAKALKNESPRNVGKRFSDIETTKNELVETNQILKDKLNDDVNTQKNIFFALATMLFMVLVTEILSIAKRKLANSNSEFLANSELKDNGGVHSVKVGEIIRVALEQNELDSCSKLFTNYYSYNEGLKAFGAKPTVAETLVTPKKSVISEVEEKNLDEIWDNDEIALNADKEAEILEEKTILEESNIEAISTKIIDILAEKLFSHGVQIAVNISEGLVVKGNAEELEQSLYNLYNYAIEQSKSVKGEKHLAVNSHKLGDVVVYDLSFSSKGFDLDPLKGKEGLDLLANNENIDLLISKQIFDDSGVKVQLDNSINQAGEIESAKVKLIFKAGTMVTKGKLVDLKIGKKSDILNFFKEKETTL